MLELFYLRRVRSYNKSRYSRVRQTARVIFYFAIFINILIIYGIFSLFYRTVFKIGTLWWGYYIFLISIFLPSTFRVIKHIKYNWFQ